jgi:Fis family transcriptional regulator, factor for inversion stimulation protein
MKAELETLVDQMISRGILFEEAVKEFEKRFILTVVDRHHHNLSKAASELRIHRNTLSKRLQEYQQGDKGNKYKNGHQRHQVAHRRRIHK